MDFVSATVRTPRIPVGTLLGLTVINGCANATEPPTDEPVSAPLEPTLQPPSDGRVPTLEELIGLQFAVESAVGFELPESIANRVWFRQACMKSPDGCISYSDGCNTISGGVEIEDGRLIVGRAYTTLAACSGPETDLARKVARFYDTAPMIHRVGDRLVLTGPHRSLTLLDARVAFPPRPLVGTTWTLVSSVVVTPDAAGRRHDIRLPESSSVVFEDTESFRVWESCVNVTGKYEHNGCSLKLDDVKLSTETCPASEAVDAMTEIFADGELAIERTDNEITLVSDHYAVVIAGPPYAPPRRQEHPPTRTANDQPSESSQCPRREDVHRERLPY